MVPPGPGDDRAGRDEDGAGGMIIFGFGGGRPKDRGPVIPARCANCGNENYLRHVSSTRWFSLFFIPLIPSSTKHFLLCPVCTQGRALTRDQAAKAQEMAEWTQRHRAGEVSDEAYAARAAAFSSYLRPIDLSGAGQVAPGIPTPPIPPTPTPTPAPPPAHPAHPAAMPLPDRDLPSAPPPDRAPIAACDACGCPLPDHAHFCPNCGARTG